MDSEHSLSRQIRLPEVGSEGQARLARASLSVNGRDGSLAEFVYLHRAGIERVSLSPNRTPSPFAHAALYRHASTRRLGAGAWRALAQLREVLGIGSDLR